MKSGGFHPAPCNSEMATAHYLFWRFEGLFDGQPALPEQKVTRHILEEKQDYFLNTRPGGWMRQWFTSPPTPRLYNTLAFSKTLRLDDGNTYTLQVARTTFLDDCAEIRARYFVKLFDDKGNRLAKATEITACGQYGLLASPVEEAGGLDLIYVAIAAVTGDNLPVFYSFVDK